MNRDVQLIGQSSAFLDVVEQASRAAATNRPVLVVGERGTGKELIAERLHHLSPRWQQNLVTMNCAALPETLIESELFGHEAGAFTGATKARAGRFEEAHGGTLFLDELATLSPGAQERLLRAVEYGEITRLGSSQPLRVDARIVAATNADLPALAEAGKFRADLLDRLSFEVIILPPLKVRDGDVAVLADHYGRRMASELGWAGWPGFAASVLDEMEAHHWPGNVRELRNVVERSTFRWTDTGRPVGRLVLDPFASPWAPLSVAAAPAAIDASAAPAKPATTTNLRAAVESFERELMTAALEQHRFNQRQTAKALGLSYDQLRHAMKKHAIAGQIS